MAVYTQIDNPELYFQVKLYSGNNSTNAITLDGDEDMSPDIVWLRSRGADNSRIYDTSRSTNSLVPNDSRAEQSDGNFSSFNSDGFTVTGTDTGWNGSGVNYVAWCFKESATAGVDIVSYTGNASARTISHSLSAVPKMFITKRRDSAESWGVYHHTQGAGKFLRLDNTDGSDTSSTLWNNTTPTSSVFSVAVGGMSNTNGGTYISYLFAEKKGFSRFGKFVGNGSANGPYVHCGFRPAYVMVKSVSTSQGWVVYDNKRDTHNPEENTFYINTSEAESDYVGFDFCANGFKHRSTGGSHNANGVEFIFLAFAEAPFCNSSGVPCNAR